jgi:dipeptidyl aminopeptidase/acylaminoacyl peptidase
MGLLTVHPQKLLIYVHGGPKARDFFGFSAMNAWLTNRGYAILQVNFRGSVGKYPATNDYEVFCVLGFGKNLTNLGNGEWGRKAQFDLLDAVSFAIEKGITQKDKVAIMGASYGKPFH